MGDVPRCTKKKGIKFYLNIFCRINVEIYRVFQCGCAVAPLAGSRREVLTSRVFYFGLSSRRSSPQCYISQKL